MSFIGNHDVQTVDQVMLQVLDAHRCLDAFPDGKAAT